MTLFDDLAAPTESPGGVKVVRYRDILYWTSGDSVFVLACDSNAGIGQRPHDALNQPPTETGYSAAKVALMEVLASGATPFVLTNALGGPRDDYGRQLLAGIDAALAEIAADVTVTGSDETNVPTAQTAIGVTVVGRAFRSDLRLGTSQPGDIVLVVGLPKDGLLVPYTEGESDIANLHDLQAVARLNFVHELLPVGSRGIEYEARELAAAARGTIRFRHGLTVDLRASAGSSTCFLASLPPGRTAELAAVVRPPVHEVADIIGPTAK